MPTPNRIDQTFADLREAGKTAFIGYFCAGDPNLDATVDLALALDESGVDVLELGVPFSDPLADGIVNQMAAQRALEAGASVPGVFASIARIREKCDRPIVLYTYLNPMYHYGFEKFHHDAAAAGADGILVLDLPPGEVTDNDDLTEQPDLRHIRLIAPTTPAERFPEIAAAGEGFLYYVSRVGVTGARESLADDIAEQVAAIKAHTDLPVAVGFGISTPEQAATVAQGADGVVVGSAIVKVIEAHGASPDLPARVRDFVKPLVDAVKSI